jgi:hypothetical protein
MSQDFILLLRFGEVLERGCCTKDLHLIQNLEAIQKNLNAAAVVLDAMVQQNRMDYLIGRDVHLASCCAS